MKKLLVTITICIIGGILFSSCSSNLTIVKRHYRKGYYIDYAKHTQTVQSPKEEGKIVTAQRRISVYQSLYSSKQSTIDGFISQDLKTPHTISPAMKQNMPYHAPSQQNVKQMIFEPIGFAKNTVLQHKQISSENTVRYDDSAGHAALSLLWIVIVVVLILWLIGILAGRFGLGGFINILLVVALILLILWLLRIA